MKCFRCGGKGESRKPCDVCGKISVGRYQVAAKADRTLDGVVFDSKKEMMRWAELKLMEKVGRIANLKRQVPFPVEINYVKVCTYYADFTYQESYSDHGSIGVRDVVEDCKGHRTAIYKLKKKLVEASYGVTILET